MTNSKDMGVLVRKKAMALTFSWSNECQFKLKLFEKWVSSYIWYACFSSWFLGVTNARSKAPPVKVGVLSMNPQKAQRVSLCIKAWPSLTLYTNQGLSGYAGPPLPPPPPPSPSKPRVQKH